MYCRMSAFCRDTELKPVLQPAGSTELSMVMLAQGTA